MNYIHQAKQFLIHVGDLAKRDAHLPISWSVEKKLSFVNGGQNSSLMDLMDLSPCVPACIPQGSAGQVYHFFPSFSLGFILSYFFLVHHVFLSSHRHVRLFFAKKTKPARPHIMFVCA